MNLVVDTHALVWYLAGEGRRLSRRARLAFAHAEAGRWTIHVPVVVLFEITLLDRLGRLTASYPEIREQLAVRSGFPLAPLQAEGIDEARQLADPRDPFDRLIAGTARRLGLSLITRDTWITSSPRVRSYW